MSQAVKKTISLPPELAREVEDMAKDEGKTVSAVVQDALRAFNRARARDEFSSLQGYWSKKARSRGVLTQSDLDRILKNR